MSIDSTSENITIAEEVRNHTVAEIPKGPTPVAVEPVLPPPAVRQASVEVAPSSPPKPKHRKVDSVTAEELKKCRRVINKLNKQHCALPFNQPVDEVLDGAIGYYNVIK
jgi:hypothetical protein